MLLAIYIYIYIYNVYVCYVYCMCVSYYFAYVRYWLAALFAGAGLPDVLDDLVDHRAPWVVGPL